MSKEKLKKIVLPDEVQASKKLLNFVVGGKRLFFDRTAEKEPGVAYSLLTDEEEQAFANEGLIITDANKTAEARHEKATEQSVDAPPAAIIDGEPATEVLTEPVKGESTPKKK